MTARRGSLRYRIVRFARQPQAPTPGAARIWRVAVQVASVTGRAIFGLGLLFVAGTIGAQVWRVGSEDLRLHNQIVEAQRQNTALQLQQQNLTARIQKLHAPEYLVPLIHEQLGLTKPGEIFVEFKAQPTPPPPK